VYDGFEVKSEERSRLLLLVGIPIGVLCGLLGLSGTEYRAPILRSFFGYPTQRVAPFNLTISLMTLGGAIVGRDSSTSAALLRPILPELAALVAGSLAGLYLVARYSRRFPAVPIERWTLSALVVVGTALICVPTLPVHPPALPMSLAVRVPAGIVLGVLIGAVSSVRSISGGELLIPALVFAFGADIKIAGSASACISFPIVLAGLVRHSRAHAYEPQREYGELVVPMGVGSALGAITGGYLLARVTSSVLMLTLGALLIVSAVRSFQDDSSD
jgi:uncharacterized membrane protein YfcA